MFGAVFVIAVSYYALVFLTDLIAGLTNLPSDDTVLTVGTLILAGFLGGWQYVRTEYHPMRWGARLHCAFLSSATIILAPVAFFMALAIVRGISLNPSALLGLLGFTGTVTLSSLLVLVLFLVVSLPTLFAGLTLGQWSKLRQRAR